MIRRITSRNDFEKFLNSNIKLSYSSDLISIGLFSKYILFLQTNHFIVENNEDSLSIINNFREKYRKKQFNINYTNIYKAILAVESSGYIPLIKDKKLLEETLFIQQLKDKIIMMKPTDDLISFFANFSTSKKNK